jgi:hypothetical protein
METFENKDESNNYLNTNATADISDISVRVEALKKRKKPSSSKSNKAEKTSTQYVKDYLLGSEIHSSFTLDEFQKFFDENSR